MEAFATEVKSLKGISTFTEYLGDLKDTEQGSLLTSKAIVSIVYSLDGSFKKYKACLVARGDIFKNLL